MQLLVIRHAIAEDKAKFARTGKPDDQRPITDEGREKMVDNARGLRALVPSIDLLASSPFTRAKQTADIVSREYDGLHIDLVDALLPDAPLEVFSDWLDDKRDRAIVAVVGHEPHLSTLVTWFTTGQRASRVELKKGGACLLGFDNDPGPSSARLLWLLAPRQLRGLA